MEYFYLIKATQKSGKADAVIWRTNKSEARALLQLDVDLEDAGIETGRGKDYQKPIRTDFPVFNDLPAEGVLDYSWCERYQLGDDGRTWALCQVSRQRIITSMMPEYPLSPLVASRLMPIPLATRHKVRPWKLSVAMNTRTIQARFLTWQNSPFALSCWRSIWPKNTTFIISACLTGRSCQFLKWTLITQPSRI
ncbi:putative exodeoxyribonuclease VIII [Klebsiella pneumoniae]|uniref:RecE family exodeoxyribonuclease n=1 Tax=Klebsiella pneumoniae TaxID=573 RepID=UPI000E2B35AC|nr:putative exodeoxyribonuclease VIII [Klebsiella pneumoniae]